MDLPCSQQVIENAESSEKENKESETIVPNVVPNLLNRIQDFNCCPEVTNLMKRLQEILCFPELTSLMRRLKNFFCSPEVQIWVKRAKILILDIGLFTFDFISDIVNGVQYFKTGYPVMGGMCLGLTVFPTLVLGLGQYLLNKDLELFLASLLLGWVYVPIQTVKGYWLTLLDPSTVDHQNTGLAIPEEARFSNMYKGLEGYLEASGQLVLNVAGILIIGLQEEVFFCQGDVQMVSLVLSFFSLLKTAGEQHFFMRSPCFPGKFSEVGLASITFLPDVFFRVLAISVTAVYLKSISFIPIVVILIINFLGTGRAGMEEISERIATCFISNVIPAVFVNDAVETSANEESLSNRDIPKFQEHYYNWNRNVVTLVLFFAIVLIIVIVNTDYFDTFDIFCHLHAMPNCPNKLHLDDFQFNTILIPLLFSTGLCSMLFQRCLKRLLKYDEKLVRVDGNLKRDKY